jgi:hypothetical protein
VPQKVYRFGANSDQEIGQGGLVAPYQSWPLLAALGLLFSRARSSAQAESGYSAIEPPSNLPRGLASLLPALARCFELAFPLVEDYVGQPIQLVGRRDVPAGAVQSLMVIVFVVIGTPVNMARTKRMNSLSISCSDSCSDTAPSRSSCATRR